MQVRANTRFAQNIKCMLNIKWDKQISPSHKDPLPLNAVPGLELWLFLEEVMGSWSSLFPSSSYPQADGKTLVTMTLVSRLYALIHMPGSECRSLLSGCPTCAHPSWLQYTLPTFDFGDSQRKLFNMGICIHFLSLPLQYNPWSHIE